MYLIELLVSITPKSQQGEKTCSETKHSNIDNFNEKFTKKHNKLDPYWILLF